MTHRSCIYQLCKRVGSLTIFSWLSLTTDLPWNKGYYRQNPFSYFVFSTLKRLLPPRYKGAKPNRLFRNAVSLMEGTLIKYSVFDYSFTFDGCFCVTIPSFSLSHCCPHTSTLLNSCSRYDSENPGNDWMRSLKDWSDENPDLIFMSHFSHSEFKKSPKKKRSRDTRASGHLSWC